MDIVPYSTIISFASSLSDEDSDSPVVHARKALLNVGDVADWCLFTIDVRNTYGLPFEVTFERHEPGLSQKSSRMRPSLIRWGFRLCINNLSCTARLNFTVCVPCRDLDAVVLIHRELSLIIPIKKMLLSEEHISKPIPTLSDRQFVVAKSSLTSSEEKAQRELFWYREELFKAVSGRWKEVSSSERRLYWLLTGFQSGGTRSGELSLRKQRLTLPMLEALRTETARVEMSLLSYDEDRTVPVPIDPSGSKSLPPPHEFVYLQTRVTNLSGEQFALIICPHGLTECARSFGARSHTHLILGACTTCPFSRHDQKRSHRAVGSRRVASSRYTCRLCIRRTVRLFRRSPCAWSRSAVESSRPGPAPSGCQCRAHIARTYLIANARGAQAQGSLACTHPGAIPRYKGMRSKAVHHRVHEISLECPSNVQHSN